MSYININDQINWGWDSHFYFLFPSYGNYGGPKWTAGTYEGTDYSVPAVDDMDAAFRTHDIAYGSAGSRLAPDLQLLYDLSHLNTAGLLQDEFDYLQLTMWVFKLKVLHLDGGTQSQIDQALNGPAYIDTTIDGLNHTYRISTGDSSANTLNGNDNVDDYLLGFSGNDQLFGGSGNDVLKGGGNNDHLYGEEGNDYIFGGTGNDTVYIGAAFNADWYSVEGDYIVISNPNSGNEGADRVYSDVEVFKFSPLGYLGFELSPNSVTTLTRTELLQAINGGGSGGSGGGGTSGGTGGGGGTTINYIQGSSGNDDLRNRGTANADFIDALGGNDRLQGGIGIDWLDGDAGFDTVYYNDRTGVHWVIDLDESRIADNLLPNLPNGLSVSDPYWGTATLYNATSGGSSLGTEYIQDMEGVVGSSGNDIIRGNSSDNWLQGGAGQDTLDGRGGSDTADFTDRNDSWNIDLQNGRADNLTYGGHDTLISIENVILGNANDRITVSSANNRIDGGGGTNLAILSYSYNSGYTASGSTGNLTISGSLSGTDQFINIQNFQFADGSTHSANEVLHPGNGSGSGGSGSTDDYAASISTSGHVNIGGSQTGNIESNGDHDWFSVTLTAGHSYQFDMRGNASGGGTLQDPHLYLRNANGTLVDNDDNGLGTNYDSRIVFTAQTSGTYYLDAGEHGNNRTGTYTLSTTETGSGGSGSGGGVGGGTGSGAGGGSSNPVFTDSDDTATLTQSGQIWHAQSGADHVTGTSGADTIYGDAGNDFLIGKAGNDHLYGGVGADTLDGGDGIDIASYTSAAAAVTVDLANTTHNSGEAAGDSFTSIEGLTGSTFADHLTGNELDNILHGGQGNDTLIGGSGADQLFGDEGNDTIFYDAGDNLANVLGGAGHDTLVFRTGAVPRNFSLIAHQFEVARQELTDTAGQSWTSIIREYDANWRLASEVGSNDDGSSWSASYELGSESWSSSTRTYDSSGGLLQNNFVYDDGTTSRYAYDSAGRADWLQEYSADGRLSFYTEWDQDESANWAYFVNRYDTAGQLTQRLFTFDDNTTARHGIDETGRTDWLQEYDQSGTLLTYTDWDQANSRNWYSYVNFYDGTGQLTLRQFNYDDDTTVRLGLDLEGRTDWQENFDTLGNKLSYTNWDQDNSGIWSSAVDLYDSSAHIYQRLLAYDNGTTARYGTDANGNTDWLQEYSANGVIAFYTDWDQNDEAVWASFVNQYDNNGHMTARLFTYDNGTTTRYGIDANGLTDWLQEYSANGVINTYTDWDQSNSETWSIYFNFHDDSGQLIERQFYYDDNTSSRFGIDTAGRTDWREDFSASGQLETHTDFDQADTAGWSSFVNRLNSNGQMTERYFRYDDGATARYGINSTGSTDWLQEYNTNGGLIRYTDWDLEQTQTFSSFYNLFDDATGVQTQKFVTYDNGTSGRYGYDGAGAIDWLQENRADGSLQYYTDFDQGGSATWEHFVNTYDTDGTTVLSRHFFNDDGTDFIL